MKQRAPQAPVIPYTIAYTSTGSTPVEVFDGSGMIDIVMSTVGAAAAGVVFGANASIPVATDENSFPVFSEWVQTSLGPSTKFLSVVSLDGNAGTLYFYLPGQTEI